MWKKSSDRRTIPSGRLSLPESKLFAILAHQARVICMSASTNYCLRGPDEQIVGFRLDTKELGHEIYDILDWADEHFSSHAVQQTDGWVHIYSEPARKTISADEVHAEPFSIDDDPRDRSSDEGPSAGGTPGDSGGNVPVSDPSTGSGGGTVVNPPSP